MAQEGQPKSDPAHDEVVNRAKVQLEKVAKEIQDLAHALHEASDATQAAVSDALGNMRSSHADALRRLRELQAASADKAEKARLSLSEALKELQQRSRPSTST